MGIRAGARTEDWINSCRHDLRGLSARPTPQGRSCGIPIEIESLASVVTRFHFRLSARRLRRESTTRGYACSGADPTSDRGRGSDDDPTADISTNSNGVHSRNPDR
jgi:hypothetical protein